MDYRTFLDTKKLTVKDYGISPREKEINHVLFPFQRDITQWALRKGRAAVFADTGLGKTFIQLEWARIISTTSLIVAPLSVARQTVREGIKIGIPVRYVRHDNEVSTGINITNYEMIDHINPQRFGAVVIDESSILKSIDGKTKDRLKAMFRDTPYRLACTATPAPNDIAEIANHAEFLGVMSRNNMLATFFVHDDEGWRLKGHAEQPFYRWLASWGMSLKKPSDLGYSDEGYILPELSIKPVFVSVDYRPPDALFHVGLKGITDRSKVRKGTMEARIGAVTNIINGSTDQWILWCGLNDEAEIVSRSIEGAVNVHGGLSPEEKASLLEGFQDGSFKVLVTKPKIAGFGMNFQNCHKQIFVGMNDSWESWYQCIRRSWRFGQSEPVEVYAVLSDIEYPIYKNVMDKEMEARKMVDNLIKHVQDYEAQELASKEAEFTYEVADSSGSNWALKLGDSVERLSEIPNESIHLSVFSPPFSSLYVYSPTERDLGNSKDEEEFNRHFAYIIDHLYRVTIPGRICACHIADVPAMMVRDGYIGMKDLSGDVIRLFQGKGWIFDSRIPIDKNQQAQSIRSHSKGLTMTQMKKDRSWLRPALPDYILKFRKPGDNPIPVSGGMSGDEWIELANPTWPNEVDRCAEWGAWSTWYGVRETDTLNVMIARESCDERHICPLQLGTIDRCIRLWSNPGETILSPFAGIGSEGYQALKLKRRFVGIELKRSYYDAAVKYLTDVENELNQERLF